MLRFIRDSCIALVTGFVIALIVASTGEKHIRTVLAWGIVATVLMLVLVVIIDKKQYGPRAGRWIGERIEFRTPVRRKSLPPGFGSSELPASRAEVVALRNSQAPGADVIATDNDAIRATLDRWIKRGEKIKEEFAPGFTREEINAMSSEQQSATLNLLSLMGSEERGKIHDWHWGVIHDLRKIGQGVIGLYASGEGVSYGWSVHPNRVFLDERLDELRAILALVNKKDSEFTHQQSVALGRLVQIADPMENLTAIQLQSMSRDEQRDAVQKLIDTGSSLRTAETNYRPPSDRDQPATLGAHARVNKWLDDAQAFLEVHFSSEAFRVSELARLVAGATTNQVLHTIDEALRPLHNCRNGLTTP